MNVDILAGSDRATARRSLRVCAFTRRRPVHWIRPHALLYRKEAACMLTCGQQSFINADRVVFATIDRHSHCCSGKAINAFLGIALSTTSNLCISTSYRAGPISVAASYRYSSSLPLATGFTVDRGGLVVRCGLLIQPSSRPPRRNPAAAQTK